MEHEILHDKSILIVEDDRIAHKSLVTLAKRLFGTVYEALFATV
jgi:hypothetical protein